MPETKTIKAVRITQGKVITWTEVSGLADLQSAVEGLIEPVELSDGSTMYVNEEYLYQFDPEAVNWVASDVAGVGGMQHFLLAPIRGPVVIVGPLDEEGHDTDLTEKARRWVLEVGGEAGATFADAA